MSATDGSGASGVAGKVDNHWGSVIRTGLLSTLFGIGNELADGGGDDAIADAIRDSSGETIGRAGDRIVERELQIQPTITVRSEEHTSELQSLMRISYAVFCLKKKMDADKPL